MIPLGKRIVIGALIATSGAFVWAVLVFGWSERHSSDWLMGVPFTAAYAVLIASWFVLPMGGVLGALMPSVIRGCSTRRALVYGLVLGALAGLAAATLTTMLMEWSFITGEATIVDRQGWLGSVRGEFTGYLTTMTPICVVWVGVWASRWSSKVR